MNGDDAWQSAEPHSANGAGLGIPTGESGPTAHDDAWASGGGQSPGRGRSPPRRSRSRSPKREPEDRDRDRDRRPDGGHNPGNNLHVSGLSTKADQRDVEALFAKYGRVQKASIMYDPHSRESRGFGFVTMETGEEADLAIASLHGTDFMGRTLNVEKARRGRARTPTPGRYYGPPKRRESERPYDPRPYDSRYTRGGYEERAPPRRYDERYPRDYDRYDRGERGYDRERYDRGYERGAGGGGGGGGGGYDRRYEERRYDERRY